MDSLENKFEVELTATEKLAQFEKEKLSRRQALARIGFQAGAAAIAALTADELLRKVGVEMRKRAGDNKVAQQVAKEFVNAGVASALPPCNGCGTCIQTKGYYCQGCAPNCGTPQKFRTMAYVCKDLSTIIKCQDCCADQWQHCVDSCLGDAGCISACNITNGTCMDYCDSISG